VRLNADKSVRWERHYDSGYSEIGHSVGLLPDGGFAVVAKGGYFSASTIIAMRTDSLGELLWQQELGGSGDNDGRHNVSVLSDGTLLVSASTSPNGNLRRGYLAKLTLEGEIIWERNYSGGFLLLTSPAIEVEDGSFVVSGGGGSMWLASAIRSGMPWCQNSLPMAIASGSASTTAGRT
jgi:outer membrane protein assembly factor BamB